MSLLSHPSPRMSPKDLNRQLRDWSHAGGSGLRLARLVAMADGVCVIAFAWTLSHVISRLWGPQHALAAIVAPAVGVVAALALRGCLSFINQHLSQSSAFDITAHIRLDLMGKALAGRIDTSRHQLRLNTLFEDTEALLPYYARFAQAEAQARILPLVLIAVMAVASPVSAGILTLTLLPFVTLMAFLGMGSADESKRQFDALSRLSNLFIDRVRALPLIMAFDAAPRQTGALAKAAQDVAARTLRVLRLAFINSAVLEFFSALSVALIAVYCGFSLLGQLPFHAPETLDLGRAFFVLALAPEVYAPMRRLAAAYHDRQAAVTACTRLLAIDVTPETATSPPFSNAPVITYRDVVCGFSDDPGFRIGPVSFEARPGQVIALKGSTGSGKTTLLRLMLAQGHLTSGTVEIDGKNLFDVSGSLAWVSQHPPILAGSLSENLTLSRQAVCQQSIDQAIAKSGLNTLVITRGNATLNERGSGLSGGERRRIGLARAWIKDAPILVLDEPTADLDAASEAEIIARLPELFKGRTVILSTHSDALCRLADVVVEVG